MQPTERCANFAANRDVPSLPGGCVDRLRRLSTDPADGLSRLDRFALQWVHVDPDAPCAARQCGSGLQRSSPRLACGAQGRGSGCAPRPSGCGSCERAGCLRGKGGRSCRDRDSHARRAVHPGTCHLRTSGRSAGAFRRAHRAGVLRWALRRSMCSLGRKGRWTVRRPDVVSRGAFADPEAGRADLPGAYTPIWARRPRKSSSALLWIWLTRLSVTPSTEPISARVSRS